MKRWAAMKVDSPNTNTQIRRAGALLHPYFISGRFNAITVVWSDIAACYSTKAQWGAANRR